MQVDYMVIVCKLECMGNYCRKKKYVELLYRHRLPERGEFSTPTRSTTHPCGSGEQTVDTHCSHKRARMYTRHAHAAPAPSALKKKKILESGPLTFRFQIEVRVL